MGACVDLQYIVDVSGNYYRINEADQLVRAEDRDTADVFTPSEARRRIGTGMKARCYIIRPALSEEETESAEEREEAAPIISLTPESARFEAAETDETDDPDADIDRIADLIFGEQSQLAESLNVPEDRYDLSTLDWKAFVEEFLFISLNANKYIEQLNDEVSEVDLKLCDLMHYIEFYDLDDSEKCEVLELIKTLRMQRREIKDRREIADTFRKTLGTNANVAKAREVSSFLGKMEKRNYTPRRYRELFQGMHDRKTDWNSYLAGTVEEADKALADCVTAGDDEELEKESVRMERVETIFDGRENDWGEIMKQQMEFYSNIEQYMMNLQIDIQELQEQLADTLQEIEVSNCNATQGYKLFKKVKDLKVAISKKTKEIEQLEGFTECVNCKDMAEVLGYFCERKVG